MVTQARTLSCPSAQPDMQGATVLGVVERGADGPSLRFTAGRVPVTDEITSATGDVPPTLVYRFAAPCVEARCAHFDGSTCQLAHRVARALDPTVDALPPCSIRKTCRWHVQEGTAACMRCPQVVTWIDDPDAPIRDVARPRAKACP